MAPPPASRTITLGPPYDFWGHNTSTASSIDFQADAGPAGLHIKNQVFTFENRLAVVAAINWFTAQPGEETIRVTASCNLRGTAGLEVLGHAAASCTVVSFLNEVALGPGLVTVLPTPVSGTDDQVTWGGILSFLFPFPPFWQDELSDRTIQYHTFLSTFIQPRMFAVSCTFMCNAEANGVGTAFIEAWMAPTFVIEFWHGIVDLS